MSTLGGLPAWVVTGATPPEPHVAHHLPAESGKTTEKNKLMREEIPVVRVMVLQLALFVLLPAGEVVMGDIGSAAQGRGTALLTHIGHMSTPVLPGGAEL